jgi:hypothetical protein
MMHTALVLQYDPASNTRNLTLASGVEYTWTIRPKKPYKPYAPQAGFGESTSPEDRAWVSQFAQDVATRKAKMRARRRRRRFRR